MSILSNWFYTTSIYYKFRYYFIRRKAPLSWLFWREILRRECVSHGSYQTSLALVGDPDCAISFSRSPEPGGNHIEIAVYNNDKGYELVQIPLSYRAMGRVMQGFDEATRISRRKIKEHNDRLTAKGGS